MREISITFVLLCLGANLLFFLLRRWEAKEKPSPNYIPDYGLKAELKEQVSSVIAKYGVKATSRLSSALALPRVIRLFFDEYENLCLDGDGVVLSRAFLETPYRGNDGFLQIGTLSYGEDTILVRKEQSDDNIYIVGCEDDNPAKPAVYATNFENFIAMCIGEYLEDEKGAKEP